MKKEWIHPAKALSGGLQLPGDKSISHRYAMIAALAEGTSELRNFAAARDCHSTLGCMKALGAEVAVDKTTVKVTGRGLRGLKSSWRTLDAENSGTTISSALMEDTNPLEAGLGWITKLNKTRNAWPSLLFVPLKKRGSPASWLDFTPMKKARSCGTGIRSSMPMAHKLK